MVFITAERCQPEVVALSISSRKAIRDLRVFTEGEAPLCSFSWGAVGLNKSGEIMESSIVSGDTLMNVNTTHKRRSNLYKIRLYAYGNHPKKFRNNQHYIHLLARPHEDRAICRDISLDVLFTIDSSDIEVLALVNAIIVVEDMTVGVGGLCMKPSGNPP
jgi:hypothetical protein